MYESWHAMVEDYMVRNEWIRHVLWVFDIRRTFDRLDDMLLSWLRTNGLGFSLILTKADKEGRGNALHAEQVFKGLLGREDVFAFSSKDGSGKNRLLSHIGSSLTGPASVP